MAKGKIIPFPSAKRALAVRPDVYTLRVYLVSGPYGEESVGHEIFRTLKVRGDQTLEDLHHAIFCSYEREHDRYYEFCLGMDPNDPEGVRYTCGEAVAKYDLRGRVKPGEKVGLAPLATVESLGLTDGQFFGYWFDLVEEWIHLIHVISIEPLDDSVDYPLLIEKEGRLPKSVPSQDIGRQGGQGENILREEDVLILLMGEMQMRWRKQLENAPISPNVRLRTALKKLPPHWLEAIGQQGERGEPRSRKDRIDELTAWLIRDETLQQIWNSLPVPSREVLGWILLERNGSVKIQNLSRRYGADTDITWWWNEGQMPETPLGFLRSKGLVFVGRIREGKRRFRIAVVPLELRKVLARIARDPRSMEGSPSPGKSDGRGSSESSSSQEDLLQLPASDSKQEDPWKGLESFNLRSFLSVCPMREDTEGMYAQTLGRIRRNPEDFPRRQVRSFLTRMIRGKSVWSRLEAYKVGFALFDDRFIEPALTDRSRLIQQWAESVLEPSQESLF